MSDCIALSDYIAFFALIVSGITAFYAYKVYQATQEQLKIAKQSAKNAEETANKQLELAREDANNSAEAAKQQRFVSCVEMYAKIYAEKAPFFEEFIKNCPNKDLSEFTFNIADKNIRDSFYANMNQPRNTFNNSIKTVEVRTWINHSNQQDKKHIALWAANYFIDETQAFINAVLILEQQLNADERKKFYAIVKVSSSEFIELFEMVNSLEDYTPVNKTAFDNAKKIFNALNNKTQ
jgi:superfamily II DNA or RNA helicase